MAEPGVKLFLPYRSPTNPRAFFIFELYLNEQGWAAHQTDRSLQGFRRRNAAAPRKARARALRGDVVPLPGLSAKERARTAANGRACHFQPSFVQRIFQPKKVWENDVKKLYQSIPYGIEYNSAMDGNNR
jgi:hypothetical protein